jgi:hypothetical protein
MLVTCSLIPVIAQNINDKIKSKSNQKNQIFQEKIIKKFNFYVLGLIPLSSDG